MENDRVVYATEAFSNSLVLISNLGLTTKEVVELNHIISSKLADDDLCSLIEIVDTEPLKTLIKLKMEREEN